MSDQVSDKKCPKCRASNLVAELPQREYRCGDCGLELAHLDTNAHGAIRGVLGWILDVGAEINERYRVTAVLGKGGFGVTYLVDDLRLHGKRRALKEIPEVLFDEHETRLLGRLSHPAVPDITDRFTDSAMVYLVLEFGGDRTMRIEQDRRGGCIPLFVLLPWVRQLCDALQYLHDQDPPIVHRDLKPDNILLDDNDRVMLIDFGIAKEATPDTATRTLGRAVSHGFSPPEQVLGTGTDARSDVYALGAIIYNLLTSHMPAAAHERITGTAIEPLSQFLPEIPPLIESAVMKALELNINLRQQSIAELAQVFDLVQSGTGSAATVSVAGVVGTQIGPTTGDHIVLPSVQLPSAPSSAVGVQQPSVRIEHPEAIPAPTVPKRSRAGLVVLVAALIAVSASGYWYLETNGYIAKIAGDQDPQGETLGDTDTTRADTKVQVAGGEANTGQGGPTGQEPLQAEQPAAQDPVVLDDGLPKQGVGHEDQVKDDVVDAAVAVDASTTELANVNDTASGVERAEAAVAAGTAAATAAQRSVDPSRLPSIYSNEQKAVKAPVKSDSGKSLLDVFEQHRGEALTEPPVASVAPQPKKVAPKPEKTTKRSPKTETKKRYTPAPSNAAAWGFKYKGAKKK